MADKTYKFISVCEREKPIQTNNPSTFIQHVASCPTCQSNLPASVIQALQPRLDQIIREKKGAETTEEREPAQPDLQEQFDGHMRDSPVFQGIEKSVTETKGDVQKIREQVDGLSEKISSDIESLGKTLMLGMTGGSAGEQEVVDVDKMPEEEAEEPSGKVLSGEEEKLQEGGGGLAGGQGTRPSPFGSPDKLPAAMREGYQPGQPGGKAPREKPPPEDEKPPQDKEPPEEEPVPKTGKDKGLPDLKDPEELEAVKAWVAFQEKKMEGGTGKPETGKKGIIPYIGDLKDMIREGKGLIKAWRGEDEEAQAAAMPSDMKSVLTLMGAINELTTNNIKGIVETMKALREGEKLIYGSPSARGSAKGPSPSPGTRTGIEHVS